MLVSKDSNDRYLAIHGTNDTSSQVHAHPEAVMEVLLQEYGLDGTDDQHEDGVDDSDTDWLVVLLDVDK